jgi:molecular chaperone DnaK
VPQIEVSFEVDANGIVSVSARDKVSGREQQMRVTPASGLSTDEINQLIVEAESSIESDKRIKETIMTRNRLESLVRNTQRTLAEFGGTLPISNREAGVQTLQKAETALKSENPAEIAQAMRDVELLANQLTHAMLSGADGIPAGESDGVH